MMDESEFDDFILSQEDLKTLENVEINLLNNSFQVNSCNESDSDLNVVSSQRRKRRRILLSESEQSDDETRVVPDTSVMEPSPEQFSVLIDFMERHGDLSRLQSGNEIWGCTPSAEWTTPAGQQRKIIPYTEFPGLPLLYRNTLNNKSPASFFGLMVSDEIYQEIVDCTNQYAINKIAKTTEVSKWARLRKWSPTNLAEIKKFFGLLIFMGIVKLPRIADYWSTDEVIGHPYPRTIMARNRFELLLQMLHFSVNDEANKTDKLHRVRRLLDMLNNNYRLHYTPSEDLCIDESLIPFRGRIIFRQYNKQKRHKYGIKEFKLCTMPGYTYKVQVYEGKKAENAVKTSPTTVVMDLCSDLLNKGHTLYTDNWYTSVELGQKLLNNETHLVGTLRKNRKNIPKDVVLKKLKKGEYIARENQDGITVMKWKDKRDVLVLSTKHSDKLCKIQKRGKQFYKPQIIIDYNKGKGAVDLSDQMTAYVSPLRKTVKWHKKLAVDLLLNTSIVNALTLYKTTTNHKIQIVDFRKQILKHLCHEPQGIAPAKRPKRSKHTLSKAEGPARQSRRTCMECYKELAKKIGAKAAKSKAKKTVTYCTTCPNKPWLCLECFNKVHS